MEIERIESASGPDRELDVEIFCAVGAPVPAEFANIPVALAYDPYQRAYFAPVGQMMVRYEPPAYTASIDAAMTLVPEGAGVTVERYWVAHLDEPVWSAEIVTGGLPDNPRRVFDHYEAPSPALALCAAALRAHEVRTKTTLQGAADV